MVLSAVLGIIGGVGALLVAGGNQTVVVEGEAWNPTVWLWAGIFSLVISAITLLLARGVWNGNKAARMFVSVIQVLGVASALWGIIASHGHEWNNWQSIVFGVGILALLWVGAETKAFFDRR